MSRYLVGCLSIAVVAGQPLAAQDAPPGDPAPRQLDLSIRSAQQQAPLRECTEKEQAASISGEIIVCRRRDDGSEESERYRARERFAEDTMNRDNPQTPDVFGIADHGVVAARGCFIPPCPPPKAYIIDFEDLPETPPGSDADRAAQGLAPRGRDTTPTIAEQLGLPDPQEVRQRAVNPSESASPEAEPSD